MNIIEDGRTVDTLENFRWPFLVAGPADGDRVPEGVWKRKMIEVGEEKYFRRVFTGLAAPARIIFFIAEDYPSICHPPYALHRRILNTHPDLEKLGDIYTKSTLGEEY